jgi:hypothetical protein
MGEVAPARFAAEMNRVEFLDPVEPPSISFELYANVCATARRPREIPRLGCVREQSHKQILEGFYYANKLLLPCLWDCSPMTPARRAGSETHRNGDLGLLERLPVLGSASLGFGESHVWGRREIASLFVSERFNGIELRGFVRGIVTEEDSHGGGKNYGGDDRFTGNQRGPGK